MKNKVVDMLRQVLQSSYIENDQYNKTLSFEEIENLLEYIDDLEKNQKYKAVIDKLRIKEEEYSNLVKELEQKRRVVDSEFYKKSYQTSIHKLNAERELIKDILKEVISNE